MSPKRIIHPGEILREEFALPLGISFYRLHQITGIPESRLSQIGKGERGITADTAHRLAAAFGNDPVFWLNLQAHYDLEVARRDNGREYRKIKQVEKVPA